MINPEWPGRGLIIALVLLVQALFPASVQAVQPRGMSWGETYNVPGTGPVETAGLQVLFVVRSNGTFVRITSGASGSETWMEVPGFYGAPLDIIEFSPGKLLVLGQQASSAKSVLLLDVVRRLVIDHFLTQDRSLSPDKRFLVFIRPSLLGRYENNDESETLALYDIAASFASSRRPIHLLEREFDAGTAIYPGGPGLSGAGHAYAPITPFVWSADSTLVAFVSASSNFSGPAERRVVESTEVSLVVIGVGPGKLSVKTARLKDCGRGDKTCGGAFTGLRFRGNDIVVESTSPGGADVVVSADALK
jgi:hypothetical protein